MRSTLLHPARKQWALAAALLASFTAARAASPEAPEAAPGDRPALTEEQRAAHALNRLGYGPRPGEVEAVAASGVEAWMRVQLRPDRLDDAHAEAAVAALPRLHTPRAELVDATRRAQQLRRQRANERAREAETMEESGADAPGASRGRDRSRTGGAVADAGEDSRLLVAGALGELQHARLARAVLSERQLREVLVDFWFNHFNVDARNPQVRTLVVDHELEAIRPHVFGSFRELLGATARSPAMLVYLNNAQSSRPLEPRETRRRDRMLRDADPAVAARVPSRGLNENYARELMELHTLGVDGGYTQDDVQEVARVMTGWSVDRETGGFVFRERWHDDEAKRVLGTRFRDGRGQEDGERLLDLLATHPATARHVATKLCQRFVADDPPRALVEHVARAFLRSGGDLSTTYEALFFAPEFFAPEHVGAKTKSPFEFLASSVRASGATLDPEPSWRGRFPLRVLEASASVGRGGDRLGRLPRKSLMLHLVDMGQPLFACGPPTGYPEDSAHWVSAGALVARLNFALALTAGEVVDASLDLPALLGDADPHDADAVVDALAGHLLGRPPSEATRGVLLAQAGGRGESTLPDAPRILALLLGSPEFQRR